MRKLLLIGVGLFLACGAFAQTDDPYAEQKAQIREIKLSNDGKMFHLQNGFVFSLKGMEKSDGKIC